MRKSFDEFLSHKDNIEILKALTNSEFRKEFIKLFMNALIKSEFEARDGEIELTIPHDRNEGFYPMSVPKAQTTF